MRQFKLSQHIPDYIYTSDELHNISSQGKYEGNWLVTHISYLNLWDARRDNVFEV
jgi:hypothetical protein